MSCKFKIKTETLNYLRNQNVLGDARVISDLDKFNELNKALTELAYNKYNVGNGEALLFDSVGKYKMNLDGSTRYILRAEPNEELFDILEDAVNNRIDPIPLMKDNNIIYNLKAVDILSSDRAEQIFEKGKKNGWDLNKILTELQTPKEQKQIILDKNITDREEIITSLLADNSFVVEVNTGKIDISTRISYTYDDFLDVYVVDTGVGYENFKTEKEAKSFVERYKPFENSKYYYNLTVPGGTNYTENEIATPDITPVIKGHAKFSTDNGIGWFRSDEQASETIDNIEQYEDGVLNNVNLRGSKTRRILEVQSDLFQKGRYKDILLGENTGSEFNEGEFVLNNYKYKREGRDNFSKWTPPDGSSIYSFEGDFSSTLQSITEDEYFNALSKTDNSKNKNQFLQLLNKKNNWVTFFAKSIIQDSAKKGYEKVLFPKGNTAAKVEGHNTYDPNKQEQNQKNLRKAIEENNKKAQEFYDLEAKARENLANYTPGEFIKNELKQVYKSNKKIVFELITDDKVITLEKNKGNFIADGVDTGTKMVGVAKNNILKELYPGMPHSKESADKQEHRLKAKIEEYQSQAYHYASTVEGLKAELERAKEPAIWSFYEKTLTNVLKKQGYDYKVITDEFGNKWNEIDLTNEKNKTKNILLLEKGNLEDIFDKNQPEKLVVEELNQKEPFSDENEMGTINEFILFGNQEGRKEFSAVEVLQNVLENTTGLDESLGFFIEKLRVLAASTKAKVKIVNKERLTKNALMQYDSETNTIEVSLDILRMETTKEAIHAILHEVTHSVTYWAYKNPQTIEQKMFKEFIDKTFAEYKDKNIFFMADTTISNDLYGFKNPIEFIAEAFTNPDFSAHLDMLDKRYDNKSNNWWIKFIDALRRILGLKKSTTNNKVVSEITKIIPSEQFIDSTVKSEKILLEKDNPYTELRTLNDKLDYALEKINENLNYNIASLNRTLKFTKDETKRKSLDDYISELETVQDSIRQLKVTNKLKGIAVFTEKMLGSLNYIESKIKDVDYSNKEQVLNLFDTYNNYLNTFSVIEQLQKVISSASNEDTTSLMDDAEFSELKQGVAIASGMYNQLQSDMQETLKNAMREYLNDIKYFKNVETKHRNRLAKEWKKKGIQEDKNAWIIRKMNSVEEQKLIKADVKEAVDKLMDNPAWDIYGIDVTMGSPINVSSPLINIMNQFMFEIQAEKNKMVSEMNLRLEKAYNKLRKEKSTNNLEELYKNIIEKDVNGRPFLKTDISYKFYVEVQEKIEQLSRDYRSEKDILIDSLPDDINSPDYLKIKKELKALEVQYKKDITKLKEDNVNFDEENNPIIIDKWKNDLSNLTTAEKELLDLFIEITEFTKYETFGKKNESLIKYSFGAKFYELPKITKSNVERVWNGDAVGMVKDKAKDLTTVRPDDVGYINQATDFTGEKINRLRIHYRDIGGNFDYKDQSYDLPNLYRLEYENGAIYKIRKEAEMQLNSLISIAENKKFHQKEGTSKIRSVFNKKYNLVSGKDTNTVKMMRNMMQNKFYDIMNKSNTKIAGADLNKVVSFINGSSAFLDLSLNIASSTANVINANAQLFLESFIRGHYIKAKGIKKANALYSKDLKEIIKDLTRPNNHSFVNQINEMFDTQGTLRINNKNYIQTDMLRKGMDTEALQVLHQSGEHWVQAVTTMSVLDGIKVLNSNSEFINKNGTVVKTEKAAASLLDMIKKDNVTGRIFVDPNVVYTTHSRITKWNEGGKTNVELLLRKKIYDTVGNYTETDQPDIMRHWYGKLMMLYRRYLIPMGQSRLRGLEFAFKRKEELTEDEQRYSYALQEYEEGTYVSLIRYVVTALKNKQYYILSKENWEQLSDYEKNNIKRAVTEIVMTLVVLPLTLEFVQALMGGDDEKAYFLLYQLRRLDTELSQYRSISESFKMMRSPIPSARFIQNSLGIFQRAFSPWTWDDVYKAGANKGKSKNWTKFKKTIPVVKEFQRTYQDLFEFQNSTWGTGL